ncbi:MAG: helicase C-terminal domain-containing protein [Candidatus Ozemobacteraceae bacterium]
MTNLLPRKDRKKVSPSPDDEIIPPEIVAALPTSLAPKSKRKPKAEKASKGETPLSGKLKVEKPKTKKPTAEKPKTKPKTDNSVSEDVLFGDIMSQTAIFDKFIAENFSDAMPVVEKAKPSEPTGKPLALSKVDRMKLSREIEEIGGAEILSAATLLDEDGLVEWGNFHILARGTTEEAPAVLRGLRPGDILLHNHPNGILQPSQADLEVASLCGRSGVGFVIHDNACRHMFVVIEPFAPEKLKPLDRKEMAGYLRTGGALAQLLPGYEERSGQIDLLTRVVDAINRPCHAILEGETGVGKSMAYLIPAVFHAHENKRRIAVSTNTINLQHQLCNKDLPLLARVLPFQFRFCLVKGRGNYLCVRRLQEVENATDGEHLLEADELDQYLRLRAWAAKTKDGSRTDLSWEPIDALWEKVNADKDTCLGLRCEHYRRCFFYGARRLAAEADLLVVNHHLLFADLALRAATKEYSQTAVIPAYQAVILDEAHNLEEIATSHFGTRATSFGFQRQLGRLYHRRGRREGGVLNALITRMQLEKSPINGKTRQRLMEDARERIIPLRDEVSDTARDLFENIVFHVLGDKTPRPGEQRLRVAPNQRETRAFIDLRDTALAFREKIQDLSRRVGKFHREIDALLDESIDDAGKKLLEMPMAELSGFPGRLNEFKAALTLFFDPEAENRDSFVHFFSVTVRGASRWPAFQSAPLDVSESLIESLFTRIDSAILVSATLSTRKTFDFIKGRLGLKSDELVRKPLEGRFASPFDYKKQALLLIPDDLPEPGSSEFMEATADPVFEIAKSSNGGTLVLCTSYAHLQLLHEHLAPRLLREGLECMKQGEAERTHLLEKFRADGNAVLFATDSFWEGVDVPGDALRNLVIAKLPFAIPDDPILMARQELLQQAGKNPFMEYQLPMAVIKLKQGFGRLIRNRRDRGTIWILDRRLVTKFYGKVFLESLPPARLVTGNFATILKEARGFFQASKVSSQ